MSALEEFPAELAIKDTGRIHSGMSMAIVSVSLELTAPTLLAACELYGALSAGDRIIGWAMAVRTSEGELLHLGKVVGETDLRRIVVTDEEALGAALASSSVNVTSDVPS